MSSIRSSDSDAQESADPTAITVVSGLGERRLDEATKACIPDHLSLAGGSIHAVATLLRQSLISDYSLSSRRQGSGVRQRCLVLAHPMQDNVV